jgi:hypothetical protein
VLDEDGKDGHAWPGVVMREGEEIRISGVEIGDVSSRGSIVENVQQYYRV